MSRRAAIILTIVLAAFIGAMFVGAALLLRNRRVPQIHLIPDGYTGWAHAAYDVAGAPPLPVEDDHRILRYDSEGKLETSSEYEPGVAIDRYYYVEGEARRLLRQGLPGFEGQIWGFGTSSTTVSRVGGEAIRTGVSTHFFVGTAEEYRAVRTH